MGNGSGILNLTQAKRFQGRPVPLASPSGAMKSTVALTQPLYKT
jgi:hypothetical protein